eukprot:1079240-Rhodomonas_salina.4
MPCTAYAWVQPQTSRQHEHLCAESKTGRRGVWRARGTHQASTAYGSVLRTPCVSSVRRACTPTHLLCPPLVHGEIKCKRTVRCERGEGRERQERRGGRRGEERRRGEREKKKKKKKREREKRKTGRRSKKKEKEKEKRCLVASTRSAARSSAAAGLLVAP